jgi:hypothetical protein
MTAVWRVRLAEGAYLGLQSGVEVEVDVCDAVVGVVGAAFAGLLDADGYLVESVDLEHCLPNEVNIAAVLPPAGEQQLFLGRDLQREPLRELVLAHGENGHVLVFCTLEARVELDPHLDGVVLHIDQLALHADRVEPDFDLEDKRFEWWFTRSWEGNSRKSWKMRQKSDCWKGLSFF